MKVYWDSSALVESVLRLDVRNRLRQDSAFTRIHALAEVFSTLTGGRLGFRVESGDAADLLREISPELQFIPLNPAETLEALANARAVGVRGGRIHDFLHARAAEKMGCTLLRTLNGSDFDGLFAGRLADP